MRKMISIFTGEALEFYTLYCELRDRNSIHIDGDHPTSEIDGDSPISGEASTVGDTQSASTSSDDTANMDRTAKHAYLERERRKALNAGFEALYTTLTKGTSPIQYIGQQSMYMTLKTAYLTMIYYHAKLEELSDRLKGKEEKPFEAYQNALLKVSPLPKHSALRRKRKKISEGDFKPRSSGSIQKAKHNSFEIVRRKITKELTTAIDHYFVQTSKALPNTLSRDRMVQRLNEEITGTKQQVDEYLTALSLKG